MSIQRSALYKEISDLVKAAPKAVLFEKEAPATLLPKVEGELTAVGQAFENLKKAQEKLQKYHSQKFFLFRAIIRFYDNHFGMGCTLQKTTQATQQILKLLENKKAELAKAAQEPSTGNAEQPTGAEQPKSAESVNQSVVSTPQSETPTNPPVNPPLNEVGNEQATTPNTVKSKDQMIKEKKAELNKIKAEIRTAQNQADEAERLRDKAQSEREALSKTRKPNEQKVTEKSQEFSNASDLLAAKKEVIKKLEAEAKRLNQELKDLGAFELNQKKPATPK